MCTPAEKIPNKGFSVLCLKLETLGGNDKPRGQLYPVYTSSTRSNESARMRASISKGKNEPECTTCVSYIETTNNRGWRWGGQVFPEAQSSVFILQRIILPSTALESWVAENHLHFSGGMPDLHFSDGMIVLQSWRHKQQESNLASEEKPWCRTTSN